MMEPIMAMNLAFASVPSDPRSCTGSVTPSRSGTRAASRCRPTVSAIPVAPHVDQPRRVLAGAPTRVDDALFALALAVLLVAVGLPWPAAVSLLS
jgi:hypothetical protein